MSNVLTGNIVLENNKTFLKTIQSRRDNYHKVSKTSFLNIFGDLSQHKTESARGIFNLIGLKINSLKGLPQNISSSLYLDNNDFKNLDFFPSYIGDSISIQYCENLESLKGIENLKDKINSNLSLGSNPKLKDILDLFPSVVADSQGFVNLENTQVEKADIVKVFYLRRRNLGDFSFLKSDYSAEELERTYFVFEKVGFDPEKFDRALALL